MALLAVGASPSRLKDVELHQHDCYEIIVNVEGEGIAEIGGKEYPFTPGSIHVTPPDMPHRKRAEGGFRDLYLNTDILQQSAIPGKRKSGIREPLFLSDDSSGTMQGLLGILLSRYLNQPEEDAMTETLYNAVLQMLEERIRFTPSNPVVSEVIRTITASYSDPDFQVTEALTATGYSKDYLRRCFHEATGMSPHTYLKEIRMRFARRLLERNDLLRLPVSEIALMCGFYDPAYFCRLFRAETGITPTAYQKKHKRQKDASAAVPLV